MATKGAKVQAARCDGTVTLKNGDKWGAFRHPNGEVYVCPGRTDGYAVTPCAPSLAKTYKRGK